MTKFSNLATRLLTAAIAAPMLIWLNYSAPNWGMPALTTVVSALAAWELMRMVMPSSRLGMAWGVAATLLLHVSLLLLHDAPSLLPSVLISITLCSLVMGLILSLPLESAALRMGWLLAGPWYVGGLLGTFALVHAHSEGPAWIILIMTIAWFGDTGGYFAGRFLGKHPLHAQVSPKKTWEGALGGLLGSTLAAMLAHFWYLPSLPLAHGIVLAAVAGSLGQVGDLCESVVKRSTGVKDSGNLVPGHGGVLDRIDALLFVSAVTWLYLAGS